MPYRAFHFVSGALTTLSSDEEIRTAFDSGSGTLWVDISETTAADGEFLETIFGFHHLAVQDCVSPRIHAPKTDEFPDHLFLIVHGVNHQTTSDLVETAELAIFLGASYVVSNHNLPLHSVDSVRSLVERDGGPMRRGPDFLVHALMDSLMNNVLPTIDRMGEIADELDEEAVRSPNPGTLDGLLRLKRSAQRLRRVMIPQREVAFRLGRGDVRGLSPDALIYFRDTYDHIVRITEMNEMVRERADTAIAVYMSSIANRQNDSMRTLSIVAMIFLPLSLVAGIYGMNFAYMPELAWHWGYFAVVGLIGSVITLTVAWLWARGAYRWWRRQVVARARVFTVAPERLVGQLGNAVIRAYRR